MAEAASSDKSGKVVIKNIGLLLSGDIDQPILSADTIVVQDGLIVAPGTHSKWVSVKGGRIADFRTFVTGELFAALKLIQAEFRKLLSKAIANPLPF